MAKKCIHCGQPLPKDDARFCNDCGQSQVLPTAPTADVAPIKVKLPPKEFVRDNPSVSPRASFVPERSVGAARPLQTPLVTQQPSYLPKRPVRQISQEPQAWSDAQKEQPWIPRPSESMHPKSPYAQGDEQKGQLGMPRALDSTPAQASRSLSEESTMVLPGWQAELELLRKDSTIPSSPATPEKAVDPEPEPEDLTPWRPRSVPPSMLAQDPKPTSLERKQASRLPEERLHPAEQPQRELPAKAWEQKPAAQPALPPMQKNMPEFGPALAVEQAPFSALAFVAEERTEDVADLETVTWQHMDHPANEEPVSDENTTRAVGEEASLDKVEDLPTAAFNVPTFVQGQPQLKIERTSTPPSKSGVLTASAVEQEEVEDQPTRPMLASFVGPRSPLPPVAPQPPSRLADFPPLENRFVQQAQPRLADFPPLENRLVQQTPNPVSLPGVYGQTSGFESDMPPLGRNPNPYTPPGNFNSSPMSPNPASQPGNTPRWSDARPDGRPEQASRPFSPMTSLPNTPQPNPVRLSAALAKPRKKRYTGRILVVVLLLLLAGGVTFWAVQDQPFTNQLAQTDQMYQNPSLGFSLHYPLDWKANVDQAHNVVHFADSSATGQVNLSRVTASGSTLDQFLSQQETQLGITGQKAGSAVTFAGESWQQVQGSVVQSGATYTITLYGTQHSGHFYALTCLTLPNVYPQMEHDNFALLRASFLFL
ncbi:MAG: hypothetical protein ABI234_07580 [Ktedonobacteraceae bacterium]